MGKVEWFFIDRMAKHNEDGSQSFQQLEAAKELYNNIVLFLLIITLEIIVLSIISLAYCFIYHLISG